MRRVGTVKIVCLLLLSQLLFVFAGCSQMSLFNLVKSEQEGEFSLGVESINLKAGSKFNFNSVGGYLPYTYVLNEGSGAIDPETGAYTAPGTVGEATVESTDGLGHRDSARVLIYEGIEAVPSSFSLRIDDPDHPDQDILLSGGTGSLTAKVRPGGEGEITPAEPVPSGSLVTYTPDPNTEFPTNDPVNDYIDVFDEQGNSLVIKVEIWPASDKKLDILPASVVLAPGETQTFNITNTTGNSLLIALSNTSFGDITVSPDETSVVYDAPSTTGSVFLTITEDAPMGDSVQADIYVQEGVTPLEITPGSVEVTQGTTVEFTASGGTMPYTFEKVTGTGTLVKTSPATAEYTPESVSSIFKVIDAEGDQAMVKIKAK